MRNTLLVCAASALSAACSPNAEEQSPDVVRPAKLVTVEAASSRRDLTFPAVIEAARSAELTFQLAGQIVELNVLEAQEVEEGFLIAKLDQRNALNALAQAQAEYDNAAAEFARATRLASRDAIAQSTLDARKTQRDVARVALSNAQKALNDTVINAPFDGAISRVYPQQFQNVQAKEPIVVIQSDKVEAVVNVPGTIISRMPQLVSVGSKVQLDAAPGIEIPATFKEASGVADEATQTYKVAFEFEPPEDLLILPGMTATLAAGFLFNGAEDIAPQGISAPLSSILAEGEDTYVWVVDPETQRVEKTRVNVGAADGENVVIVAGLDGGEQIVATGVSFLHEGMEIRPWTPE